MRKLFFATFLLVVATGVPAKAAYECVLFDKGTFPATSLVSTLNGTMLIEYQTNINIPLKTTTLANGNRVTGAFPNKVPLAFAFIDKDGHLREIYSFLFRYVTQANTPVGKVDYVPNGYPLPPPGKTESVSPTPPRELNTYLGFFIPKGMAYANITFPNSLIVEGCIDPGDIIQGRPHIPHHR
jgi:hypothetical protein